MSKEDKSGVESLVTRSEDVAWGASVIAGTRVPVDTLFEYLEAGKSLDEFLGRFPTVPRERAVSILERARQRVGAEASSR